MIKAQNYDIYHKLYELDASYRHFCALCVVHDIPADIKAIIHTYAINRLAYRNILKKYVKLKNKKRTKK